LACFGLIKEGTLCGVTSSSVCVCLNLCAVINPLMPEFTTECTLQRPEFKWPTHYFASSSVTTVVGIWLSQCSSA